MTLTELEKLSDEELAALAKAPDPDAETVLLLRYKETVKSKAGMYYILGADRDDVIQEGMIGLVNAIRRYDPSKGAAFRTFADLCIVRQIISAIKYASRQKFAPLNDALSLDSPVSDDENAMTLGETLSTGSASDPLKVLVMGELAELLLRPETGYFSDFEETVLKYLTEGYNYREIAGKTGRTPKQTDNAIQRIKKKLKVFFEE